MITAGTRAPALGLGILDDESAGGQPWQDGPCILVFFKVTCPVCQMVAPQVTAMAESGCRVLAIGQDPTTALDAFSRNWGQVVPAMSEPPPYRVSDAYGIEAVPTVVLVGQEGVVLDAVAGWDRERWNRLSLAAGGNPVSWAGDGLPVFRPG